MSISVHNCKIMDLEKKSKQLYPTFRQHEIRFSILP